MISERFTILKILSFFLIIYLPCSVFIVNAFYELLYNKMAFQTFTNLPPILPKAGGGEYVNVARFIVAH